MLCSEQISLSPGSPTSPSNHSLQDAMSRGVARSALSTTTMDKWSRQAPAPDQIRTSDNGESAGDNHLFELLAKSLKEEMEDIQNRLDMQRLRIKSKTHKKCGDGHQISNASHNAAVDGSIVTSLSIKDNMSISQPITPTPSSEAKTTLALESQEKVKELDKSQKTLCFPSGEAENDKALSSQEEKIKELEKALQKERSIVASLVPKHVAEGLRGDEPVKPRLHEGVTFFFSDVVGFTDTCKQLYPWQIVGMLNRLYCVMDYLCDKFGLFKVETIGDAYVCCCGLPEPDANHAEKVAKFAIAVNRCVRQVMSPVDGSSIQLRIGIHTGSAASGVVGVNSPRYCVFGDTVNVTARHESSGEPGRVHCSAVTKQTLDKTGATQYFNLIDRGLIEMKGKGQLKTYWLEERDEDDDFSCSSHLEDSFAYADGFANENDVTEYTDPSESEEERSGHDTSYVSSSCETELELAARILEQIGVREELRETKTEDGVFVGHRLGKNELTELEIETRELLAQTKFHSEMEQKESENSAKLMVKLGAGKLSMEQQEILGPILGIIQQDLNGKSMHCNNDNGLSGSRHGLSGSRHGLSGSRHGLSGSRHSLSGSTHGLSDSTHEHKRGPKRDLSLKHFGNVANHLDEALLATEDAFEDNLPLTLNKNTPCAESDLAWSPPKRIKQTLFHKGEKNLTWSPSKCVQPSLVDMLSLQNL